MKTILLISCLLSFLAGIAQQPRLMIPMGHMFQVKSAVFTEEDKYILTYSENVKIWEASTGKLVKNIVHPTYPTDAHMMSDNETVVIAYGDSIRVWNIWQDKLIRTFAGNNMNVFDSINAMVIMNFDDNDPLKNRNAALYNIKTGKLIHQFDLPVASWSDDGNLFMAVSFNTVRLYDSTFKLIYKSDTGNIAGIGRGYKMIALQKDNSLEIIDPKTNTILQTFSTDVISKYSVNFFPQSNNMIIHITPMKTENGYSTQSNDAYILGFDLDSFKVNHQFKEQKGNILGTDFTRDFIAASHADSTIRIWEAKTGKLIAEVKDSTGLSSNISFSNDRKYIIASSNSTAAKIWDIGKRKLKVQLDPNSGYISSSRFSADGRHIMLQRSDDIWLWNLEKGQPTLAVKGDPLTTVYNSFLDDRTSKLFLSVQEKGVTTMEKGGAFSFKSSELMDKHLNVYNVSSGNLEKSILLPAMFDKIALAPDGKEAVITSFDSTAFLLDINSGKAVRHFKDLPSNIRAVRYTRGYDQIEVLFERSFSVYNVKTLSPTMSVSETEFIAAYGYSNVSGITLFMTGTKNIYLRDVKTGRIITHIDKYFEKNTKYAYSEIYSPAIDSAGRYFCMKAPDKEEIIIIDAKSNGSYKTITRSLYPNSLFFNKRNNLVVTFSNGTAEEWDPRTQKLLNTIKYDTEYIDGISPEGKYIVGHRNSEVSIIENQNSKVKHRLYILPGDDYIVTDAQNRYDGTEAARKKLYFTCGAEIIELEQLKDQLWVPGLAGRIMKGESINAKSLQDLGICGLTPLAEAIKKNKDQYHFKISPRRGGLGETIVQVNGIEVARYPISKLQKTGSNYLLAIDKKEIEKFFITGEDNTVGVRAMTSGNNISSRSTVIDEEPIQKNTDPPNLFAVIVGVSDYKGEGLDLHYAAKDAKDFANALEATSKKLLNNNGEHVFIYRLHTDEGRDRFPEKNSIRLVFEEIGKKAKPNDVLLVFFAGHGKMDKDSRQFHFITADASKTSITGSLQDVSISTKELTEWIRPSVLKAQKRILIFDACNSGQAINDLVKIGEGEQQFVTARDDEQAEQVKAIEKMNEKSGLFILSASASDQKAYEMSKFSQGVLTYSLLQAIKQQPDILSNQKFLNVTRWFAAAEKSVTEIAKESNAPQQAQIVSTTNFDIGIVDEEVRNRIILPLEKPMFTGSEFRNAEVKFDNLQFRNLVDKQLNKVANEGVTYGILFRPGYSGSSAYTVSGDYKIVGSEVVVSVMLIKGGTRVIAQFEMTGSSDDLNKLAEEVVGKVLNVVSKG